MKRKVWIRRVSKVVGDTNVESPLKREARLRRQNEKKWNDEEKR